jgi:hypothetical protein
MKSMFRGAFAVLALSALAVGSAEAQERRSKEIRLDMISFQTSDGNSAGGIAFPAANVALGIYLNQKVAIEPMVGIDFISGDNFSGQVLSFGAFVPYYFKGDGGRSGLFLSPGLMYSKGTGDIETDGEMDYGVDFGFRKVWRDNLSWRGALTLRDGDSFGDMAIGASFGLGLFWK